MAGSKDLAVDGFQATRFPAKLVSSGETSPQLIKTPFEMLKLDPMILPVRTAASVLLSLGLFLPAVLSAQDSAAMIHPIDVTANADGAVFVADRNLPGIWKYADGKLEVYFKAEKKYGTPLNAIRCLAVDGDGNVLAGDSATFNVYRFDEDGKPQPLADGRIGIPMGIATNSAGDVFVSDGELHRIYKLPQPKSDKVKPEVFATVAAPRGLAMAAEDVLWVLSGTKDPVRKINADGEVNVVVEGFKLEYAGDIAINSSGSPVVSDSYKAAILTVDESGELNELATGEPLMHPVGMALQGDELLVADSKARTIFKVGKDGKIETLISAPK